MNTLLSEPTIRFCENNLSGLIAQPANSYSSLIISLAGLFILARKKHLLSRWLGWTSVVVGLTSFIYHASFTFIGQLLDLGSMFLLASFLLVAALRGRRISSLTKGLILIVGTLAPLIVTAVFRTIGGFNIGIPLFVLLLFAVIVLEVRTAHKERRSLTLFGYAFLVFAIGWGIWLLDLNRIWCDVATFHFISGHAVWHIANAVALVILDKYYTR